MSLAQRLREAGLRWTPARGDRFVIPGVDLDGEVFVLSNMVVDLHEAPSGRIIGFNGTTEWALDSVEQREALWLPGEEQLRDLLGDRFHRLERTGTGYRVVMDAVSGDHSRQWTVDDGSPSNAYARALLVTLGGVTQVGGNGVGLEPE